MGDERGTLGVRRHAEANYPLREAQAILRRPRGLASDEDGGRLRVYQLTLFKNIALLI